ncbi:alpha/beta fold hydrolase [Vibrio japonicus]|uniref:Alpha/beta fold hydrolase n=1 Tax=Vibrio japonicus TaxID=1824638 RepID=A0ABY5LIR3_9VIBR|nr:alpha/beta fold hydrolase [Vibrio japonicus]UUM29675.1 alpha/beta fold hydrolase [Vibrio japonicus]
MENMKLVDGTSYFSCGEGDTVIFIHGVGLDKSMWGGQVAGLQKHFHIIGYDMLGHGESPEPQSEATIEAYANQLERLITELKLDKPITVVGFSMGGLVARAFALKYAHRIDRLVILNSVFNRTEEQRSSVLSRCKEVKKLGPGANVEAAIERWFSKEYRAASPAQIDAFRERIVTNSKNGYLQTYQLFGENDNYGVSQLDTLSIPVLVATGELDVGSTPEMAYELARNLPNAQVVVLDQQRHMMPVEAPHQVNDMLLAFIQGKPKQEQLEQSQQEQVILQEVVNGA